MKIQTSRFGEVDIDDGDVIDFDLGPLGFEDKHQWVLIENGLLGWLQSAEDPGLAFVVGNPFDFYSDYEFVVGDKDLEPLQIDSEKDVSVLSIISVPPKVENMTINLLAPIVINVRDRRAKQVILNNNKYSVRHYVYSDLIKNVKNQKREVVSA